MINSKSVWWVVILSVLWLFVKWVFSKNFIEWYNSWVDSFFITIYLFIKKYILRRKVLIVVDDLDRLNPTFLPDILLWLSRISEIERWLVNVIISADPQKLAEWIKVSNNQYSWNEWYEFLEKIIDTPYYIDDLHKASKILFWNKYKEDLISDFNWFKYVEDFIEYLPNNIRQIKRYFRFLYTYIDELKRYWEDEINIQMLLFVSLFKLEYPKECLDFIKNDMDILIKEHHWIMFYKEKEESKKFRDNLSSDIKKKYFDFMVWKLFMIENIQSFYYFFDNIDKITKKEFFELYLNWNKDFEDLKRIYFWNYIELLQFLVGSKDFYYWKLVDENLLSDMKLNQKYVKKIYSYISNLISVFEDSIYISKEDIESILWGLMRFSDWTTNRQGIDFKAHRKIEIKILKQFIKKLKWDLVFLYRYNFYDYLDKEYVNNIYWNYFTTTLNKNKYDYKLSEINIRKFIYERIIENGWIKDLSKIDRNNILNQNLLYLLYGFLEEFEDRVSDSEKIIKMIRSKKFKEVFMWIPFSTLNYRWLWSLKAEVLNKLPDIYDKPLKYLKDEVDKYIS